ncbi:hypothetical protein K5X82_17130 [Halosquirtibacter xylanolyticus]|uniref:hypothetical protein n=1 Tax=Halosquirtibacter xylanolyticus TaxID=3374599 RepID=UPI00374860C7|nr:hypothetical protein K5X82_17130 [Prolixibacteraceae bacterium]
MSKPCCIPDFIYSLENLATAIREGKHLLSCELEILKLLAGFSGISPSARAVYHHLYHNFSTNYYDEIVDRTVLLYTGKAIVNDRGFSIDILELKNSNFLSKSILLTENLTDTYFYEYIAKKYLRHKDYNFIEVKLKRDGGGGSQVANKFKEIIDANEDLCLCICDSDKKYPKGGEGDTVKSLRHVRMNQSLCELYCLKVREAENIIPLSIFKIHKQYRNHNDFDELKVDHLFYIDYKQGLTNDKLLKDQDKKLFWKEVIANVEHQDGVLIKGVGEKFLANIKTLLTEDHLMYLESTISEKKKMQQEGKPITDKYISILEDQFKICKNPYEKLTKEYYDIWVEIALIIIRWCCGSRGLNVGI